MTKKELESKITGNTEIKAIMLYGEDSFLIEYYGEKLAQKALAKDCQKNTFYFGEFNFESALSCFSSGSLFGELSLVWIKTDKKIPKKQLDTLINTLIKNETGYLIVEFHQSDNQSAAKYALDYKSMIPSFRGNGVFEARLFAPNLNESMSILKEYAKKLNIQTSDFVLRKILEQQSNNLGLSIAEMRKYSIYDEEINSQTIDELGYSLGSVKCEEILELLLYKKPYFEALNHFLEKGYEEVMLIQEIEKYFFQLFLFQSHTKIYGSVASEDVLGYKLPQHIFDKKRFLATKLNEMQYEQIFLILNTWRHDSISGNTKTNGFLRALIKIQAILK